jgi:trans-2,3-dihydro-3-hydroxyanthranilate isomerase
LVKSGRFKSGEQLTIHQGEAMLRPSTLLVQAQMEGDQITGVTVGGQAIVVARGEFKL